MRSTGKTYNNRKGAVVAERRMEQPCKCEQNCFEVLERRYIKKKMSYNYYVRSSSGKETELCRTAFLSVHGLQKNEGSLKSILKQQRQGRLTPESDRRGKHQNRPNKCTDEDIAHVLVHMKVIIQGIKILIDDILGQS